MVSPQLPAGSSRCQKRKGDQARCQEESGLRVLACHLTVRRALPAWWNLLLIADSRRRCEMKASDIRASDACTQTPHRAYLHEKDRESENRLLYRPRLSRRHDRLFDPERPAGKPGFVSLTAEEFPSGFRARPSPNRRAHRRWVKSAIVRSNVAAPNTPETSQRGQSPRAAG